MTLSNRDLPLAIAASDRGDYTTALGYFRKALKADPESALIHAHLAVCLFGLRKYFASSRAVDTALSLAPNLPMSHVLRSMLDTVFGDSKSAKASLDEALRLDPENKDALVLRCASALFDRDIPELAKVTEALLSLYPDDDQAHYFASRLASLRLDADTAEKHARVALRIAPNKDANHIAIGWAFWVRKDFDKAQEAALSALALSPNSRDAHSLLAAIEMHRKPLTGWFHRIGYLANNVNIKTATLYFVPALFLYMTAGDVLDYFGHEKIADEMLNFVMVVAGSLLLSTHLYSRKAAKHQNAATLNKDY
jgi:tetratricopeptide (TPR) repeat protein